MVCRHGWEDEVGCPSCRAHAAQPPKPRVQRAREEPRVRRQAWARARAEATLMTWLVQRGVVTLDQATALLAAWRSRPGARAPGVPSLRGAVGEAVEVAGKPYRVRTIDVVAEGAVVLMPE